ncbi:MAG TPA: CarD family transcriptional regulator [Anaerolineales bacterium]|nr:CarD family transcriptional regulator [Anaerolineales bacterium]
MEMKLEVGDRVVHPQYGVGHVVKLDEREFEPGVMRRYYEVSIPGSTLWVPLDQPTYGLRKLTVKSEIDRCREILASRPLPLTEDSRLRQSDLSARLKEGTIAAHCEVVRDLSAYGAHKPISGTIAAFLRNTQDVLCQEWATVEGITLAEAAVEISLLLEKSKLTLTET